MWCSTCPPFSRIQLWSSCRHWLTALLVIRWSKWCHSSSSRSFRWLTSRIRQRYNRCCKMTQSAASEYRNQSVFPWEFSCYFLSTTPFSTLRPLIKILPSFDNILLICLSANGHHSWCKCRVCVEQVMWQRIVTRSLAIAKRPCDCCIILKSGSYTKAIECW